MTRSSTRGPTRAPLLRRLLWPLAVVVATLGIGAIPVLLEPDFYMRGDTAAQFAPTWWYLGQLLRDGQVPPTMDPGSFAGGNYAAEALFGIYNPVNWVIWLVVSASPDLRLAVTAVKLVVLAGLALGCYLLAREYGAERWAAAAVAVAVPFSGFTLFWDAGSWAAGLIAFAWTPWMWWAFRRVLHGRMNPFLGFLVGALAVTQGNPYGTLAVALVGVGLLLEGVLRRAWRGVALLALVGVCVAALLPLVYLPLVETVSLATRGDAPLVVNNGRLRPTIADLLLLGSPTFTPQIAAITGPMRVPATYFCWFLVPLLPWLRFGALRGRGAELAAVGFTGLVWFAMTVGPSKLWLFRWPLRLSEYVFLCLGVVLAVVLSHGLARDRVLARALGSAGLVLLVGYLAWAEDPELTRRIAIGTVGVLAMTAVALVVARLPWARTWAFALVLILGTGAVVGVQVRVFGENASSRVWHFPHDVSALQASFEPWGEGTAIQIADLKPVQDSGDDRALRGLWSGYLAGSMFHVAGVDAVNNYTGMGLDGFTSSLCMNYDGLARGCGYDRLWRPSGGAGSPPLADQLRLSTVVTQPDIAQARRVPPGWTQLADAPGDAVVLRRDEPLPWPGSRLSAAGDGLAVGEAASDGPHRDTVEVSAADDGGRLTFAALGWPGYRASLDGVPLEVDRTEVGLLQVEIPPGASGTVEVEFSPPGRGLGAASAALGALVALVAGAVLARRRRAATGLEVHEDAEGGEGPDGGGGDRRLVEGG